MTAPRPSFAADHPASERQRQAADPRASTWLSANAGSGKTRVLTDRVARLLLAGVDPANILCLTYTKAAAAEMQTRLFRRLGGWAMKQDEALIGELRQLGLTEGLEPVNLREARRLFAQALETPGGLKIQTIHAFCASLLRRFPLEAGVSPQFREMDERAQALLCAEVSEELAEAFALEFGEGVVSGRYLSLPGAIRADLDLQSYHAVADGTILERSPMGHLHDDLDG